MIDAETTEEEAKVVPMLRLLRGGKGPPENTGEDWLSTLKKGAVFSCKISGGKVDLELYGISFKHDKTVVLFNALGNGPPRAVDPKEFCKLYSKFEVIEEGGQLPEGDNNDGSEVRSGGVVDNEDAPRGQPQHEDT